MEKMAFGRTGHESTRVIFGAASLWGMRQEKADRVLDLLLEYGVNHIDTAASYGEAELRVGAWMPRHRERFFLATKTGERSAAGAREGLQRSLERLRVDRVDLIQLHNLVEEDEWATALGPGGALEALVEARDQGLVRFIGVTGHGTPVAAMHLRSLERFPFDSVLLPYNFTMMQEPGVRRRLRASGRAVPEPRRRACRRSSPSPAAAGGIRRSRTSAGTSRCAMRTPSAAPSTSCWRGRVCSSTAPATRRSCVRSCKRQTRPRPLHRRPPWNRTWRASPWSRCSSAASATPFDYAVQGSGFWVLDRQTADYRLPTTSAAARSPLR